MFRIGRIMVDWFRYDWEEMGAWTISSGTASGKTLAFGVWLHVEPMFSVRISQCH